MSFIDALFTPNLILDHTCLVVGHFGVTLAAWGWWIDLGKQKARCSRPDPYYAFIQTVANVGCKHRVLGVTYQQIQKNGKIDCFCNVLLLAPCKRQSRLRDPVPKDPRRFLYWATSSDPTHLPPS